MTIRVGINGFGRMGKLALQAGWNSDELEFVHINETKGDAACHAHLLQFDSVHGRWGQDKVISSTDTQISIDDSRISFSQDSTPEGVNWADYKIDLLLECSGKFKTAEQLQTYFDQGIKKIVVSAPCPDPALNLVYGVNHERYDPALHHIVTAASCTTNCLAPIVKVMHESLGIKHGSMTTIHNITNTQTIVDKGHKDLRRARASGQSLIPTTTGSAKAITKIFPELEGKLNGLAVRVPLLNGSLTDFVFESNTATDAEQVNALFKAAAESSLKDVLGYETRPLVSADYTNDPRSAIIDAPSTMVINGTQVKILAWYDNEWGYVNRMIDIANMIARTM
ncbi:MAG: ArsJ-associated glyceraldehyde-3-phosphate dehydrogenase [Pseudomonadota bacterium]|nr:ArsJ-associated glyceraldehyde-3-phosphate dehydrogenase [Pseudomonadota bacterium]MDO7711083.1 ArsJ-associated glyceraldehyde-3-phosphate dehydrogenase [Pseudomonadota bacterium]